MNKKIIILFVLILIVLLIVSLIFSRKIDKISNEDINYSFIATGRTYVSVNGEEKRAVFFDQYDYIYPVKVINSEDKLFLAIKTGPDPLSKNAYMIKSVPLKVDIVKINDNDEFIFVKNLNTNIDPHDLILFDVNHYIVAEFYEENNTREFIIKEVQDEKNVWEFNTKDHSELRDLYNNETDPKEKYDYFDYLHFNSFAIDQRDNNLLVSFRNLNSIVKINRTNGEIMWFLGGKRDEFNLPSEATFINQHSLSFESDNNILLYDNGTRDRCSRILELNIDEKNKKVLDYKVYELEDIFTESWGTVIEINKKKGIYLIHYGLGGNANRNPVEIRNLKTGRVYNSIWFAEGATYQVTK